MDIASVIDTPKYPIGKNLGEIGDHDKQQQAAGLLTHTYYNLQ